MSPAFELALYTLAFLVGEENNEIQIGDFLILDKYRLNIKCYKFNDHG